MKKSLQFFAAAIVLTFLTASWGREYTGKYVNPAYKFSFVLPDGLLAIDSTNLSQFLSDSRLELATRENLKNSKWQPGSVYILKEGGLSDRFSFLVNPTSKQPNAPKTMSEYIERQRKKGASRGQNIDVLRVETADRSVKAIQLINRKSKILNTIFALGGDYFTIAYYPGRENPEALRAYQKIVQSLSFH